MSNQCEETLPDGGRCQQEKAAGAPLCGQHMTGWVKNMARVLRLEHEALYNVVLKSEEVQRRQHELGFWPAFYSAGPLLQTSERRLREFEASP